MRREEPLSVSSVVSAGAVAADFAAPVDLVDPVDPVGFAAAVVLFVVQAFEEDLKDLVVVQKKKYFRHPRIDWLVAVVVAAAGQLQVQEVVD